MKVVKTIWVFLMIVSFYGCSSMSQKECVSSDWYAVGYEDGYRGYTTDQFSKHHKACAKHGITAGFQSYLTGREQGLSEFCKPNRAYQFGSQGKRYQGVCPETMESEFDKAYQAGKRLYKMQVDIRSIKSEIRSRQKELNATESEIKSTTELLVSDEISVLERGLLLKEILELNKNQEIIEEELHSLKHEKTNLERQYAIYQESSRNTH